jgi:L-fuconolactonase
LDRPCVELVLEAFGAERVLWGSDWPVLLLASDYAAWWSATEALLAPLAAAQRSAVLGGNTRRFYRLDARRTVAA